MVHQAMKLYNYHVWANRKVIDHVKGLPEEIFTKQIQSVFTSIQEVMTHILIADHIWLGAIREDGYDQIMGTINRLREETKEMTLAEIEAGYLGISNEYARFLSEKEDLDRPLTVEHPSYGRLDTSIADLVQHVVDHGTYHRGNITAMLRQMGHSGVPTDYAFYLYSLNTTAENVAE